MAETEKLVANTRGKADIWIFFLLRETEAGKVDHNTGYCKECKASIKLGGGTSNLNAHIRRHHPLLLLKPAKPAGPAPNRSNPQVLHARSSPCTSSADADVSIVTEGGASTSKGDTKQMTSDSTNGFTNSKLKSKLPNLPTVEEGNSL